MEEKEKDEDEDEEKEKEEEKLKEKEKEKEKEIGHKLRIEFSYHMLEMCTLLKHMLVWFLFGLILFLLGHV